MKIKTYKETETELELPHFFMLKYGEIGNAYYAIFNEKDALSFSRSNGLSFTSPTAITQFMNEAHYQQISQDEFTLAYANAVIAFDSKATALLGIPELTTSNEAI